MKKFIALFLIGLTLLTSCAQSMTTTTNDGKKVHAEVYGWANMNEKNEDFSYSLSIGNVVWSCIFAETIVIPVVLTGWYLFEPEEYIGDCNLDESADTISLSED